MVKLLEFLSNRNYFILGKMNGKRQKHANLFSVLSSRGIPHHTKRIIAARKRSANDKYLTCRQAFSEEKKWHASGHFIAQAFCEHISNSNALHVISCAGVFSWTEIRETTGHPSKREGFGHNVFWIKSSRSASNKCTKRPNLKAYFILVHNYKG